MGFVKFGLLILLALAVSNAAILHGGDIMMVVDGDRIHDRESRSSNSEEELKIPWNLDRIDQREPELDGKYESFASGTGIDIYILADGIEDGNEEFGQYVSRAFNIQYKRPYPLWKCTKYGTSIAIMAAGSYTGVARNSKIHVLRVIDDFKQCSEFISVTNVIKAMQHVIWKARNRQYRQYRRRSVLVMPIITYFLPILKDLVEEAVENDIVVVTAAGNWFDDACKYYPGNSPHVINVGSTLIENGEDKLYKTNYGPCVTLYAPGQYNYSKIVGTVQACGMVAGAAALVLEKHPRYSPAEVKQYLIDMATDGVINMDSVSGDRGANKLLYIGKEENFGSGGQFSDDTFGKDD